ncbi:5928_t:CDS:2 [Dentiscutata erythropus]|uniref:5928_t:CDS:1 n=1 Tax=Dentiscutata erythropus TaxID=1348616 RepID=A0A9N9AA25_9GLOM|nr:5928_t:CDS:2 [Dentiscutata erythropus]
MERCIKFNVFCLTNILKKKSKHNRFNFISKTNELRYGVYHKLPHHSKYSKRGEIVVTLPRAVAKYSNSGDVLSINEFENADKTNNNPYYLIKLVNEKNPENCLLKTSKFEDEIIIHLNRNNVFHFDYYTSVDQCNSTFASISVSHYVR